MRVQDLTEEDWVSLEKHLRVYCTPLCPKFQIIKRDFYTFKRAPSIHMRGPLLQPLRFMLLKPFDQMPRYINSPNNVAKAVCFFRLEVGK